MEIALEIENQMWIFRQKWNHQEEVVQHLRWLCIFCSGSVPHNHREKYFVLGKITNKNKNILF
jgi:hypothetical protein